MFLITLVSNTITYNVKSEFHNYTWRSTGGVSIFPLAREAIFPDIDVKECPFRSAISRPVFIRRLGDGLCDGYNNESFLFVRRNKPLPISYRAYYPIIVLKIEKILLDGDWRYSTSPGASVIVRINKMAIFPSVALELQKYRGS